MYGFFLRESPSGRMLKGHSPIWTCSMGVELFSRRRYGSGHGVAELGENVRLWLKKIKVENLGHRVHTRYIALCSKFFSQDLTLPLLVVHLSRDSTLPRTPCHPSTLPREGYFTNLKESRSRSRQSKYPRRSIIRAPVRSSNSIFVTGISSGGRNFIDLVWLLIFESSTVIRVHMIQLYPYLSISE